MKYALTMEDILLASINYYRQIRNDEYAKECLHILDDLKRQMTDLSVREVIWNYTDLNTLNKADAYLLSQGKKMEFYSGGMKYEMSVRRIG